MALRNRWEDSWNRTSPDLHYVLPTIYATECSASILKEGSNIAILLTRCKTISQYFIPHLLAQVEDVIQKVQLEL